MPKYQAEQKLYVKETGSQTARLLAVGEHFQSDDPPGKHWIPLDDEARSAVDARPKPRAGRVPNNLRARAAERAEAEDDTGSKKKAGRPAKGARRVKRTAARKTAKKSPNPDVGKSVHQMQTEGKEPTWTGGQDE